MRMKFFRDVSFASMLLVASVSFAAEPVAPIAAGSVIIKKMAEAYAAVSSYQDSGVVLTHDPAKDQPDQILFRTFFIRPDGFRFEWNRHHPYPPLRHVSNDWVIWTDAQGAHLLGLGKQRDGTLTTAIGGAAGVSRGASHHVALLLLPELTGSALTDLADVHLLGEQPVEGAPCFHLRGNDRNGTCELWVGKNDYMIRRVVRRLSGNPVEEIRRDIRINHEIPRRVIEGRS